MSFAIGLLEEKDWCFLYKNLLPFGRSFQASLITQIL